MSKRIGGFLVSLLAACQSAPGKGPDSGAGSQPAASSAAPRGRMPAPAKLTPEARQAIAGLMNTHGEDVTLLLWSIVFLDTDGSAVYAEKIAGEAIEGGDAPDVPKNILRLHGELRAKARGIAELSKSGGAPGPDLAKAFGDMAATCVACHQSYLYSPIEELNTAGNLRAE